MSAKPKTPSCHFRRILFFGTFSMLVLVSSLLFIDWLHRTGMTPAKWTLFALYFILTSGLAFGFSQSLFGFLVLLFRRDRIRISRQFKLSDETGGDELKSRVALLFPVYNEDPVRFYNGIEATYLALKESGRLEHFTFCILSDSTNPNRWIEEESLWQELTNKYNAHGQIIYRHRISNLNQKSGNISDFCRRWGSHFDYMICFDADSLMSAQCILKLVHLMEMNPEVGIIQTAPSLFGAETLFARFQQFANRIHGEISSAGLNFWQQSEGNYWGHNAIIRIQPFIEYCSLPELPGPRPLGGRVLSHDFVEAALMRKAGYEVWLAYDIGDSFEELPPTLLDFAQRDRRWCQGNLQHGWIALFGHIPFLNRVHMLNGIYSYLAAPLWLLFLGISTMAAYSWESSGLTLLIRPALLPFSPNKLTDHMLVILALTLSMIFLPKLFAILRLAVEPDFRRRFGGGLKAAASVLMEVLFFTLLAPSLMLFHSAFVVAILTGNKVSWRAQNRNAAHTTWMAACQAHIGHSLIGLLWAVLAWKIDPSLMFWMSPILFGWLMAIPLSVFSSHTDASFWLKSNGYLVTPEEIHKTHIIDLLDQCADMRVEHPVPIEILRDDFGLIQAILDPYINALHLDFLPRRRNQTSETRTNLEALGQKLIDSGAPALSTDEKIRLLNDPKSMRQLHRRIWTMTESKLHNWWRLALSRYSRRSLFVAELDGPARTI
ncbi:glucans biosynthesis glucosyltransferase MdoH [Coraliomargarita parva]|uniref:glucans biosynthesis glucosyltransferase MdoH n=1 Tax=Coraliomargarita parva TaxID=3014050 RepID=UPI0022B51BA4|nr:glucans biosynthesis glucosyltransferase MdoH [Coraliomargarita parva]